jgi:hypothetical protein
MITQRAKADATEGDKGRRANLVRKELKFRKN